MKSVRKPRKTKLGFIDKRSNKKDGYTPEHLRKAKQLASMGLNLGQIAEALDMPRVTFDLWRKQHPEFDRGIKNAIIELESQVSRSPLRRARGYRHRSERVFCSKDGVVTRVPVIEQIAPDVGACMHWLANRASERWKWRPGEAAPPAADAEALTEIATHHTPAELESKSEAELAALYREALEKAAGNK